MAVPTSIRSLTNARVFDKLGIFVISCSLFFGGAGLGYFLHTSIPPPVDPGEQITFSLTMMEIVTGNAEVILTISLGGFLLGIPTIISLISNGVVFGVVLASIVSNHGLLAVLVTIFPHGIPEIVGICLAGMLGFRFTRSLLHLLLGQSNRFTDRPVIWEWIAWFGISIGLILVAATIETSVTPWLARRFL